MDTDNELHCSRALHPAKLHCAPGTPRRKAGSSAGVDLESVVDAAVALIDSHGLDQLTLASVAGVLGIRTPSLYNHVEGLAGLRQELAMRSLREMIALASRATVGRDKDEAVMAFAIAYWDFAREHPGLYKSMMLVTRSSDARLQAAAEELLDLVLAVLSGYRLSHEESLHAVRALRSALHGFVSLDEAGQFGMPLDKVQSLRRLVRAVIRGIREGEFG